MMRVQTILLGVAGAAAALWAWNRWGGAAAPQEDSVEMAAEVVARPAVVEGLEQGRAVGQSLVMNPNLTLAGGLPSLGASAGTVDSESSNSTIWEGRVTDVGAKFTTTGFGANYSGSAIGVAH